MPSHLGEEVRRWRTNADLSQAELADLVGVQVVTVSRWERGISKPAPRNVEAIQKATGNDITVTSEPRRAPIYYLAERVEALEAEVLHLQERLAAVEQLAPTRRRVGASTVEPAAEPSSAGDLHGAAADERAKRIGRRR